MNIDDYKITDEFGAQGFMETLGLLHTPEGVRDLYNAECEKKLQVEKNIHEVLSLYHFQDIQTPTFEYFDIFNKERGTIASREMYKFFDKEGNTLVLRPDFTPSIARCAAKYYKDEELPIRLCYIGNTFINTSRYQGKLKEVTQVGAELIQDGTVDADAKMIALTIECLKKAGLKDFQLEIGHADFLNGLLEEASFNVEESMKLKGLIESKNVFGVEELVKEKELEEHLAEVLLRLPELFGSKEHLDYAKSKVKNLRSLQAITRLEQLDELLRIYQVEKYVSYDLGMLSKYNYYTGIIYRAYSYGTGDVIVTGGRYDNLVRQFGKDAPAIGFGIAMDQLMLALERQNVEISVKKNNTLLVYESNTTKIAIQLANQFRRDGMCVEVIAKAENRSMNEYIEYGRRHQDGGIIYLESEENIQIIHLASGEKNTVSIDELLRK